MNTSRDDIKPRSRRRGTPPANGTPPVGVTPPNNGAAHRAAPPVATPDPRELKRRFGSKGGDVERCAARFLRHEAVARTEYHRLTGDGGGKATPGEHAVADLVRIAALLDGLRRFGGGLDLDRLDTSWREARAAVAAGSEPAGEDASPVVRLLAAEIAWAGGILFEGEPDTASRRATARARLHAELEANTDTDGTPSAELLPVAPEWLASLVRCLGWAKAGGESLWNEAMSERFDGLLRALASMTRCDGRLSFSSRVDVRPLLIEAAKRSGFKSGSPVRRLIVRLQHGEAVPEVPVPGTLTVLRRPDKHDPPVVQSDWAKLAVARDRWRPAADLVAIDHTAAVPQIEFSACGRPVLAGEWRLRIQIDGEPVPLTPDWEAVTWFSDRDADYLELEWPNELGVTVCRQMLLTRGDHQLVLADVVSTPGRAGARIELESSLPLAAGVSVQAQRPLRDVRLDAGGLPLRCLPVALPQNHVDAAAGGCDEDEPGRLVLHQSGTGGVYAPLVFDWNPRRRSSPLDWRSLTVTENHRRLGPAEAAGLRVRIGDRQLLLYRGLNGSKAARAVLGHHHASESVIARFTRDGDVEPLVLVNT